MITFVFSFQGCNAGLLRCSLPAGRTGQACRLELHVLPRARAMEHDSDDSDDFWDSGVRRMRARYAPKQAAKPSRKQRKLEEQPRSLRSCTLATQSNQ